MRGAGLSILKLAEPGGGVKGGKNPQTNRSARPTERVLIDSPPRSEFDGNLDVRVQAFVHWTGMSDWFFFFIRSVAYLEFARQRSDDRILELASLEKCQRFIGSLRAVPRARLRPASAVPGLPLHLPIAPRHVQGSLRIMLQFQGESCLLAPEEIAAPQCQRLEASSHDPGVAPDLLAAEGGLRQGEAQKRRIRLLMAGEKRHHLSRARAVEQEVRVGDQQEISEATIQGLQMMGFGGGPVPQALGGLGHQVLHAK